MGQTAARPPQKRPVAEAKILPAGARARLGVHRKGRRGQQHRPVQGLIGQSGPAQADQSGRQPLRPGQRTVFRASPKPKNGRKVHRKKFIGVSLRAAIRQMRALRSTDHRSHGMGQAPPQAQIPWRKGHGRQFGAAAPGLPRPGTPRRPAHCQTRTAAAPPTRKRGRRWKRSSRMR